MTLGLCGLLIFGLIVVFIALVAFLLPFDVHWVIIAIPSALLTLAVTIALGVQRIEEEKRNELVKRAELRRAQQELGEDAT